MQWYTLSEYWCTGTEAGTHQQSLGFVPYLLFGPAVKSVSAGRVGAKFIPSDKSCTKAKVSRQEPVAGEPPLGHTAALSGTLLIENTFDRKLGHFWSKTGTLLIENWDTFDWNQGHPAVKIGAFDQGNRDTKCTTYFISFWHPQNRFCQSFGLLSDFWANCNGLMTPSGESNNNLAEGGHSNEKIMRMVALVHQLPPYTN